MNTINTTAALLSLLNRLSVIALLCAITIPVNAQVSGIALHQGHAGHDTTYQFYNAFVAYGRTFTPNPGMTVTWDSDSQLYAITGTSSATFGPATFHFKSNNTNSLFTLRSDGFVNHYQLNAIDTLVFSGQKFVGIDGETFFTHNTATDKDNFYGDISVILDGRAFDAVLGSASDPGAILNDNTVQQVWMNINDVTLKGLAASNHGHSDLILRHSETDPDNTYYGHGNWYIKFMETVQLAKVGSATNPGIVVRNSVVDSVKMSVVGFGFLWYVLPTVDDVNVEYNHQAGKYAITGYINVGMPMGGFVKTFGATYAPSFEINAGDSSNPGFLLNTSNGRIEVADATFSLKRINGPTKVKNGGFEINDLTVRVVNNLPDSISGRATFPPGMSLEVSLEFVLAHLDPDPGKRFYVDGIQVTWEAASSEQAIPVGNTGFNIVKIGGGVYNLYDYHNLALTGTIGMIYGEEFELDLSLFHIPGLGKKNLAVVYVEGDVRLSTQGISFTATGDIGGLFHGGQWSGVLAELSGGIDIKWNGTVNLDANIKAYAPPFDIIDADANLSFHNNGDLDAHGSATLQVPGGIPVIGGKRLGSAQFATRYLSSSLDQSYAAGWSRFNLGFDHVVAGIKASFKNGHISKVGAGQARSLSHQNISDEQQHPIGANGLPDPEWYACGITQHYTLPGDLPAAYLQNQMVINDLRFQNPLVQHMFFAPAVATVTSPSSSMDVKLLTPADPHHVYQNQGQTTPQDNTLTIDFTRNFVEGGSDTINFITVNQAAEAYSSIDWVHQPGLMLTPGEYLLTLSGYCPVNGEPLEVSDMHYNVSPVYPRPDITLQGDGNGNFDIDYSAYITDSTTVSLYWNYDRSNSGNLIAHHPYHGGELIGDSLYRWAVNNWFPGIISEEWVYFYAVIDDHINNPVRSNYDSVLYQQNLIVNVLGGADSVSIVLTPADTTMSEVYGIDNGGGVFVFANVPLGEYTLHAYNTDTTKAFNFSFDMYDIDGNVLDKAYNSPSWVAINFTVVTWDNGSGLFYFNLEEAEVSLFGTLTDTADLSLPGNNKVYLLDQQHNIVAQSNITFGAYRFTDIPHGRYDVVVQLDAQNEYHWTSTEKLQYLVLPGLVGVVYVADSVEINGVSKSMNFRVVPGNQGVIWQAIDIDNHPVDNVVISIQRQDGAGPLLQAVTTPNGLAIFTGDDVPVFTTYTFRSSWPDGYQAVTPQGQTFQWTGTTDPQLVIGER